MIDRRGEVGGAEKEGQAVRKSPEAAETSVESETGFWRAKALEYFGCASSPARQGKLYHQHHARIAALCLHGRGDDPVNPRVRQE
ncbi:hypothetical protein GCM10023213_10960 [Prosthecobacter algae]|uniref:Uncharacterized protein n=1 Tax=Prosthecobacter algae TaxID=1144682 RepID=A0ABP9NX52_9BACT